MNCWRSEERGSAGVPLLDQLAPETQNWANIPESSYFGTSCRDFEVKPKNIPQIETISNNLNAPKFSKVSSKKKLKKLSCLCRT